MYSYCLIGWLCISCRVSQTVGAKLWQPQKTFTLGIVEKTAEQFEPKWQRILFYHQKLFRKGKAIFGRSSGYRGIKHAVTETVAVKTMLFLFYVTAEDRVMRHYESRGSRNDRHKEKRWTRVAVVGENGLWPNSYWMVMSARTPMTRRGLTLNLRWQDAVIGIHFWCFSHTSLIGVDVDINSENVDVMGLRISAINQHLHHH